MRQLTFDLIFLSLALSLVCLQNRCRLKRPTSNCVNIGKNVFLTKFNNKTKQIKGKKKRFNYFIDIVNLKTVKSLSPCRYGATLYINFCHGIFPYTGSGILKTNDEVNTVWCKQKCFFRAISVHCLFSLTELDPFLLCKPTTYLCKKKSISTIKQERLKADGFLDHWIIATSVTLKARMLYY